MELVLATMNESTAMCNLQHVRDSPETDFQKSEQNFMAVLFGFHFIYMCVFLEVFIGG